MESPVGPAIRRVRNDAPRAASPAGRRPCAAPRAPGAARGELLLNRAAWILASSGPFDYDFVL